MRERDHESLAGFERIAEPPQRLLAFDVVAHPVVVEPGRAHGVHEVEEEVAEGDPGDAAALGRTRAGTDLGDAFVGLAAPKRSRWNPIQATAAARARASR